jgi:anaerobic selenocysteine-containing dehydrogenase
MDNENIKKIRGYCSQCVWNCPIISYIKDGQFIEVKPDLENPRASTLCPKALAGPELVYDKNRLKYPLKRTNPKGSTDPGWERITWDDALNIVASRLSEIKTEFGAEAVAIAQTFGGSAAMEILPWVRRFSSMFGTPNNVSTTHICNWHRDHCSAYTFGKSGVKFTQGFPEYERAGCILIWGNNIYENHISWINPIEEGLKNGAKLIVVDPRKTKLATNADVWLQVKPGTDGALALGMLNVMIENKLYDEDFAKNWTNGPLLVRTDNGEFLTEADILPNGNKDHYMVWDKKTDNLEPYNPKTGAYQSPEVEPALTKTIHKLKLNKNKTTECKTAFQLLKEIVSQYNLPRVKEITTISENKIIEAITMIAANKPVCWWSFNGIEQNINASQTNRALCIFYALIGSYDKPGGNVLFPSVPTNPIMNLDYLPSEIKKRCLGYTERPLGPAGIYLATTPHDVYKAILTEKPYPIKAMLSFGENLVTSYPPTLTAKKAHSKLEFHVQCDLFMTPTAELADIVLPVASSWETWHIGIHFTSLGNKAIIQLRPAVVPPQYESWSDMKIIFELAKKLGYGDKFWNGDIEASFDHLLSPLDITVDKLRKNPGGIIIDLPMEYKKYAKKDVAGNFSGFPTPSKRIEIYSQVFRKHGNSPLPVWTDPFAKYLSNNELSKRYPFILTGAKILAFCHSQHRSLPSLRKRVAHPFLEINSKRARNLGISNGEWVILETPRGAITLQARLNESIYYNVVCTQHGWWQSCPELNLPSYDPYTEKGANVNLLYDIEEKDPISGSFQIKGYPCNVKRIQ